MTIAVLVAAAGSVLLAGALGIHSIPLAAVEAWLGLALLVVAAAYALSKPALLMKTADGRLPLRAWIVLGPYLAANHLLFLLRRTFSREPPAHEIVPGLWLGRWPGFGGVPALHAAGIRSVLDLTSEYPRRPAGGEEAAYLNLGVLDYSAPSPSQLRKAIAFISERLDAGPVYVHCAVGHGRSAMVVAAWLVASGRVPDLAAALALVRSKRPRVLMTGAQQRALRAFAENTPPAHERGDL